MDRLCVVARHVVLAVESHPSSYLHPLPGTCLLSGLACVSQLQAVALMSVHCCWWFFSPLQSKVHGVLRVQRLESLFSRTPACLPHPLPRAARLPQRHRDLHSLGQRDRVNGLGQNTRLEIPAAGQDPQRRPEQGCPAFPVISQRAVLQG